MKVHANNAFSVWKAVITMLAFFMPIVATAQSKVTVSGTVYDELEMPVISATVIVVGQANKGAITDLDGRFTIKDVPADATLRVSYVGYKTQEILLSGRTELTVNLLPDSEVLDEVVVTALGIKRSEKALSYNVQEIKSDDLTTNKDANFVNTLNGKVAGVSINKSGAGVGGATRVVMRGAKSIEGNNNALYVIDGIPLFNVSLSSGSDIMGGRAYSEGIADLNPEEIESISVLSGPSAAALYGSSAANGVILINTKGGEAGKLKVSLNSSTEFGRPFVMPKFQNRYGARDGEYASWGEKLDKPSTYDPAKDFFQLGITSINAVNISGGSENSRNIISFAATNSRGIVPNNDYERYNASFKNTTDYFDGKLQMTLGASYIYQSDRNMVTQGQYWNPIPAAYLFPRGAEWEPIKTFERYSSDRNIPVQYWPLGEGTFAVQNPYWTAYRNVQGSKKHRYIFNVSLKYNILDWMNLTARYRLDQSNSLFEQKLYASTNEKWSQPKGQYEYNNTRDQQYYGDVMLNVNKNWEDVSLVANLGASIQDYNQRTFAYGGPLVLVPNHFTTSNINSTLGTPGESGGGTPVRNVGLFASVEAGYKNMVFLTATGRNDWSSRLVNSAEPSFFYPSIGLSVLPSTMFEMPEFIDMIKLRGSFTQVGAPVSRIGLTPGTETSAIKGGVLEPNRDFPYDEFRAERTNSYEFGLEAKFFQGLNFNLTYYKSNTYNQTFYGTLDPASGYNGAWLQAGNIENRGIEASLGYSKSWSNISFSTNLVYSMNHNEIKEMVKGYKHALVETPFDIDEVAKGENILKVGGSINDVYASSFFQEDSQGFIRMVAGGDPVLEARDPVFLGRTTPDFNIGWNNSLNIYGVTLSVLINGRFGGIVTSDTQAVLDQFGVSEASAQARDNGGVMLPNQGLYDAQKYYSMVGDTKHHGYYTYDATNIRIQNATIGYDVPTKWLGNVVRGLHLSVIGTNLLMIYNKAPHDPELTPNTGTYGIGNDYFMQPSLRSIGFNVKVNI